MDDSVWRFRSRVVAYVDLGLSSLYLLVVGILWVVGIIGTAYVANGKSDVKDEDKTFQVAIVWVIWLTLVLFIALTAVEMWAALKLLSATEVGRVPNEALKNARIWRNVSFVFLVFGTVGNIMVSAGLLALISVLWRGMLLYVVYMFIRELESVVTGLSHAAGNPQSVIVR